MTPATITTQDVEAAKAGSPDAAERILKAMKPVLKKLARNIAASQDYDDAIASGTEAVWEAVLDYDPTKGTKFTTHAYSKARFAMLAFISENNDGPIVDRSTVQRYRATLAEADGDVQAAMALADQPDRNFSSATFMAAHEALQGTHRLDATITDEDGDTVTAAETMEYAAPFPEDAILDRVMVAELLASCSENEVLILSMSYGLGDYSPMSDTEIAEELGAGFNRLKVLRRRNAVLDRLRLEVA